MLKIPNPEILSYDPVQVYVNVLSSIFFQLILDNKECRTTNEPVLDLNHKHDLVGGGHCFVFVTLTLDMPGYLFSSFTATYLIIFPLQTTDLTLTLRATV